MKKTPHAHYLTQMHDPDNVLEFDGLQVSFSTENGVVRAVDGVSFHVPAGKVVGVVGESGCGKSVTSLSAMGLLQKPHGRITGGQIRLNMGQYAYDLTKVPPGVMQQLRGNVLSMVFQEPMTALNPVMRIGAQIGEVIRRHRPDQNAEARTLELLQTVGIPDPQRISRYYPHNLSGGMRQRVMIAMAVACSPRLIIADEPTTALDVTLQAQILQLLLQLKDRFGSAIMLITHDLGVVAQVADLVVVMYAGRVVETGTVWELFHAPAHPYTVGLLASRPTVGKAQETLFSIPGQVPDPLQLPRGCYFHRRCHRAGTDCAEEYPCQLRLSPTHFVSCYRAKENEDGK